MSYNQRVPGDFQGLAHIGSVLSDLGRVEEAEAYLRRALAGVDDALTHYNLGVVLAAMGRLDEAIVEYGRALERDPLELNARNNLAVALARQGRMARASEEWQRVLTMDPANRSARTNLEIIRGPGRH
jgi:tetratricopeptide (TPR) repeat protein